MAAWPGSDWYPRTASSTRCSIRRPPTWSRAAQLLLELLEHYPDRKPLVAEIKDREHEGDRLTHEIVQSLHKTFVTPIDREDIYDLARLWTTSCDFIDQVADELNLYGVEEVPPEAIDQAGVILRACPSWSTRSRA